MDTGFCPQFISHQSKNQVIHPYVDMAGDNVYDCSKLTKKELEAGGRFHGQYVLNEFLEHLPKEIAVSIYPLVIYDKNGRQTKTAWMNSLKWIEKEKIDFVLTASGFINGGKLVSKLPAIWFVPSGRAERSVTQKTTLFPQNLAPTKNLFVIGDYFDENQIIYDQGLLYQEHIDYYFVSGKKKFSGTSRAVAEAMGKALMLCFNDKEKISVNSLRLCLSNKQKSLVDPILKKEFKSF